MTTRKTVKLRWGQKIEDRAVEGTIVETNERAIAQPRIEPLHEGEPYERAIVLKEYGRKVVQYVIYKGTQTECFRVYNELSNPRYRDEPYVQPGNGTLRVGTLEDLLEVLWKVKRARENINRVIDETVNYQKINKYSETLYTELRRHKNLLDIIKKEVQTTISRQIRA